MPPPLKCANGRPKKGEVRPLEPRTRIERQTHGMTLPEMLADLPCKCDVGCKRNSQGFAHDYPQRHDIFGRRMRFALVLPIQTINRHHPLLWLMLVRDDVVGQQRFQPRGIGITLRLGGKGHVNGLVQQSRFFEDVLPRPVAAPAFASHRPSRKLLRPRQSLARLVLRSFWLVEAPLYSL